MRLIFQARTGAGCRLRRSLARAETSTARSHYQTLESQFAEIADNQPELLRRHSTEAGVIEKAASLRGEAGQRSLARSALAEAAKQLPAPSNRLRLYRLRRRFAKSRLDFRSP